VSTATQKLLDGHETAVIAPSGSTEAGVDQPTVAADAGGTLAISVAPAVIRNRPSDLGIRSATG
jgi:hypothetical protein